MSHTVRQCDASDNSLRVLWTAYSKKLVLARLRATDFEVEMQRTPGLAPQVGQDTSRSRLTRCCSGVRCRGTISPESGSR